MQIKKSPFAQPRPAGLVLIAALACHAGHAEPIYHCVRDGHLTLTDQPCDGTARNSTAGKPALGGPLAVPEGSWHGAAQLTATLAGKPLTLLPKTSSIVILIAPDGSVTGSLRDLACELKGQLGDKYDAGDRAIRLAATGCRDQQLNLSYSGTLQLSPSGQPSRLAISGLSGFIAGNNPIAASIRANLNRDGVAAR